MLLRKISRFNAFCDLSALPDDSDFPISGKSRGICRVQICAKTPDRSARPILSQAVLLRTPAFKRRSKRVLLLYQYEVQDGHPACHWNSLQVILCVFQTRFLYEKDLTSSCKVCCSAHYSCPRGYKDLQRDNICYSHSIVPVGFGVTSTSTRFTPGTSWVMRSVIFLSRS